MEAPPPGCLAQRTWNLAAHLCDRGVSRCGWRATAVMCSRRAYASMWLAHREQIEALSEGAYQSLELLRPGLKHHHGCHVAALLLCAAPLPSSWPLWRCLHQSYIVCAKQRQHTQEIATVAVIQYRLPAGPADLAGLESPQATSRLCHQLQRWPQPSVRWAQRPPAPAPLQGSPPG